MDQLQVNKPVKTFFVTSEGPCPACSGTGYVANPLWVAYWQDYDSMPPPIKDAPDFDDEQWSNEWTRKHGYRDMDKLGPEEEPCDDCNGTGILTSKLPLSEALVALGYYIPKDDNLAWLNQALNEGDGVYRP